MNKHIERLNKKISKALSVRQIAFETPSDGGILLTDLLIRQKTLDPSTANVILEESTGFGSIDPTFVSFNTDFLKHAKSLIPGTVAIKENVFPLKHEGNYVHLVMVLPNDEACIKRMEFITGSRIKPYCSYTRGIHKVIHKYYTDEELRPGTQNNDIKQLREQAILTLNRLVIANADLMTIINDVPVIRLLSHILNTQVNSGASDIHFEPQEDGLRIRSRIDGVMQVVFRFPAVVQKGILNRIKLISGMDLEETGKPQDANIDYHLIENREIDIRVSALPSIYGEKIVLRILDKGKKRLNLTDLGMDSREFESLNQIIRRPNGLILLTGPTGSGKTTTLYGILNELNTEYVNISTAEDPVEYKLNGITQISCTSEAGLTFQEVLRSFLRQDPDIIMVGEIRDMETADIAVKSAMTGHVVLSTLHTNDAAGAINRLINMGIPAYLVASAQITVIAQRLVRRVCSHCKIKTALERNTANLLKLRNNGIPVYKGEGCPHCSGTGYRGRVGIYEMLVADDDMSKIILKKAPASVLKAAAVKAGMTTLRKAALKKLVSGVTTVEEVLRVTMDA
ncbi:GspE/PulE family protein [Desulfococcaceae bacterium HSG7]|nr:GspE/PulE family protein [Desulfococcaceae bacterium HSG7]